VDYIFRWLGITFLPGYRDAMLGHQAGDEGASPPGGTADDAETHRGLAATKAGEPAPDHGKAADHGKATGHAVQPAAKPQAAASARVASNAALLERAGVMKVDLNGGTFGNRAEQFASFQTDAPSCDNCGAITVRNGNCYLCHNCGNSMGCS
jgi:ribonucleoside-diphosphate reductase alpha chain